MSCVKVKGRSCSLCFVSWTGKKSLCSTLVQLSFFPLHRPEWKAFCAEREALVLRNEPDTAGPTWRKVRNRNRGLELFGTTYAFKPWSQGLEPLLPNLWNKGFHVQELRVWKGWNLWVRLDTELGNPFVCLIDGLETKCVCAVFCKRMELEKALRGKSRHRFA